MGYAGGPLDRGFWPFDSWRPILGAVKDMGYQIVTVGRRATIVAGPPVDLDLSRKTTLRQLFAIVNHCRYFLGMDSGPMHVAQALGVRGLGVFNPRHPAPCIIPAGSGITPVHVGWNEELRPDVLIHSFQAVVAR